MTNPSRHVVWPCRFGVESGSNRVINNLSWSCTSALSLATLPTQQTCSQFVCIFVALLPSHVSRSFKPHSFTLIPPSTLQRATPEPTPSLPYPLAQPSVPIVAHLYYIMNVTRASSQKPKALRKCNNYHTQWEKSILSISVMLNYSLCLGQKV